MKNFEDIYEDHNAEIENDKVKASFDKLIKILDIGFDKDIYEFNKEIILVAKKIMATIDSKNIGNNEFEDNIMDNDFYLPINSMRNYLKPNYSKFNDNTNNNNNINGIIMTVINEIHKFVLTHIFVLFQIINASITHVQEIDQYERIKVAN